MRRILSLISLLSILLISCKKDNETVNFEGQYKADNTATVSAVIMYTQQGQVTNSSIIQDFLQRKGAAGSFIFGSTSIPTNNNVAITISSTNNTATITNYLPAPIECEITNKTTTEYLLAQIDSSQIPLFVGGLSRCEILDTLITIINAPKKFYPLPFSTGLNGYYKFRSLFSLKISNNNIYIPLITTLVSSSNISNTCALRIDNKWNYFNSGITSQLQTGDTIVYQQKQIQLIKQ